MRSALALTLLLASSLGGACRSTSAPLAGGAAAGVGNGTVRVVNAYCPVMDEHPVSRGQDPYLTSAANTREYKGRLVGFCCDDCPETWDAMTDDDRAQSLARAIAHHP